MTDDLTPNARLDAGETARGELVMLIFNRMKTLAPGQRLEVSAHDLAASAGFKPLKELLDSFTAGGGKLWVCPPCFNARGLDKDKLIAGATFAGGAAVVEFLGQGAASLSY